MEEDRKVEPWGIDKGQFADIYYRYEKDESVNYYAWKPGMDSIQKANGGVTLRHYKKDISDQTDKFYPGATDREICANRAIEDGQDVLIDCFARPMPLTPKLENCGDHTDVCDNSDNTHVTPKAVMKTEVNPKRGDLDKRTVKKVVQPYLKAKGYPPKNPPSGPKENEFMQNNYQIYAVDENWNYIPRSDLTDSHDNIFDRGNSRYGQYIDKNGDIVTKKEDDNRDLRHYFKGLEYVENYYIRGGKKLCIQEQDQTEGKKQFPSQDDLDEAVQGSVPADTEETTGNDSIDFKAANDKGFCSDIPQPTCPEITKDDTNKYHGNATWPQSGYGNIVKGSCITDYYEKEGTPERTCGIDKNGQGQWKEVPDSRKCETIPIFTEVNEDDTKYCYKINKINVEHIGGENYLVSIPEEERPNESEDKTYSYYIKYSLDSDASNDKFEIYKVRPKGKTTIKFIRHEDNQPITQNSGYWDESDREYNQEDGWVDGGISNWNVRMSGEKIFYIGVVTTGKNGPADIKIHGGDGKTDGEYVIGCGKQAE